MSRFVIVLVRTRVEDEYLNAPIDADDVAYQLLQSNEAKLVLVLLEIIFTIELLLRPRISSKMNVCCRAR